MRSARRVWIIAILMFGLGASRVAAQIELPFRIPGVPASSPKPERASPQSAHADKGLLPVTPNPNVVNELEPDKLCRHVEENTDVWGKLADYGGLQAQLRMQRLLTSDFKNSDLTPQDLHMLRYIAYTTIWVPPWLENNLARLYSTFLSESNDEPRRLEQAALQRVDQQLQAFKSKIADFPGDVRLMLDGKSATGASARPGGVIALSRDFLNRMDESTAVQRLVLAHELSHLYKRHTIKELQYQLITSSGGFELGRKLLRRFNPNTSSSIFGLARDTYGLATAGSELLEFVRTNQVTFQSDQELEADACSVEWMKRLDHDPVELWHAFAHLQTATSTEENDYLRTHPSTEERRANIAKATQLKKQERVTPTLIPGKR